MEYFQPFGSPRVGLLTVTVRLPGCRSLKEKRSTIKRVEQALRSQPNLSIAEVGAQDDIQRTELACAVVTANWSRTESQLLQAQARLVRVFGVEVLDYQVERLL